MRVEWTDPALDDLDELHDYLALEERRPLIADRLTTEIFEASRPLAEQPRMGRRVPENPEHLVFERIIKGFRLMYIVDDDAKAIFVVAVVSSYRSLEQMDPKPWARD